MRPFFSAALSCALLSAAISAKADTIPYPNPGVVAPTTIYTAKHTGDITGYFIRGGALSGGGELYTDSIRLLDVTQGTASAWLFNSQTTSAGTQASFGNVVEGDTLVFEIMVQDLDNKIWTYASDPAYSEDGYNHAYLTAFAGGVLNGVTLPEGLYAGMEDTNIQTNVYPPNLDYRDITTLFQNVQATPAPAVTPEPSSFLLLGTGVLGTIGAVRRRFTR